MISEQISDDIPPKNENFEYGYPNSSALLQFRHKLERCKPHKAARHQTKCDITADVKLYPTVYQGFTFVIQSDVALQNQVH